jgi:pantoate--beta-alanine ligase
MQTVRSIPPMRAIKYPPYARVGFVPTMGFLHEGHLSLIDEARKTCDVVVVSIFVNPAQFGPQEDLASYPRDLERDLALLEDHKVDYVFFPSSLTMYPDGYRTWVNVSGLSDLLCGASRPGHFKGVCTVVLKLINIVRPHYMYLGEKDFQQLTILKTMAEDLNLSVKIMGCPIIREADGLAKSSRNVYLKGEQRQQASCLYQALINSRQMVKAGERDAGRIIAAAETILISNGARPDYIEIVNSRDLSQTTKIDENSRMLIAAWVGTPRLIDNMPLKT